jgi:hypothetical protein
MNNEAMSNEVMSNEAMSNEQDRVMDTREAF